MCFAKDVDQNQHDTKDSLNYKIEWMKICVILGARCKVISFSISTLFTLNAHGVFNIILNARDEKLLKMRLKVHWNIWRIYLI